MTHAYEFVCAKLESPIVGAVRNGVSLFFSVDFSVNEVRLEMHTFPMWGTARRKTY